MSNDSTTAQLVLEAVSETCHMDLEKLQLDATLDDLGLDSMSVTSIILDLETRLGFEFKADQMADLFQAGRVRDFVHIVEGYAIPAALLDPARV